MTLHPGSYRLGVIIRIMLLLVVGFTGISIILLTPYWLISFWLGILLIVLLFELIRYHERSLRTLRDFLQAIREGDFSSLSILDEKNRDFQASYQFILDKFRNLRIEKETNYHYLKRVIEHVDTALICLKDDQSVQLINQSALDLLQVTEVRDLKALKKIDGELGSLIGSIESGGKTMIRFIRHGQFMKLSIRATEFTLDHELYKIVSLQDIKSELEEQELESWQKLVRVLTHEIMNSTIPITNMVSLARQLVTDREGNIRKIDGLNREEGEDLMISLHTAETRSQGLSNFVQTTKSLTRIPDPVFRDVAVKDLFNRLHKIFKKDLDNTGITLTVDLKPNDLVVKADPDLIEQVLINLIKNAVEALKKTPNPAIELTGCKTREGGMAIQVCDNGQGISKEDMDQIFIPFYSTKKEGSGIGLSLSMQIMKLHKGRIDVRSDAGKGTCVFLVF